jgi:hypothetical protein
MMSSRGFTTLMAGALLVNGPHVGDKRIESVDTHRVEQAWLYSLSFPSSRSHFIHSRGERGPSLHFTIVLVYEEIISGSKRQEQKCTERENDAMRQPIPKGGSSMIVDLCVMLGW